MGINTSNFQQVGLSVLMLFIVLTVEKPSGKITGPQREVVSIYGDNFTTPSGRPQYFIEVYRCVKVRNFECFDGSGPSGQYPIPKQTEEIEIVVPDITNRDRDPINKKKFYKYVVYNHTSCTCGDRKNERLYKNRIDNEVSEDYFIANYSNNPVNLLRLCDVCNSPQPRYHLYREHENVLSNFKYLAYQQCLPGCVVKSKITFKVNVTFTYNEVKIVELTNDTSCKAYDRGNAGRKAETQKFLKD